MKNPNGEWIAIFKTGKHKDASGNERDWTEADLDTITQKYNEQPADSRHDAPVVTGHPQSNSPSYGWVKELKRTGNLLLGKFEQLAPEFVEAWQRGTIKKRSISLYPDLRLRHVGFVPLPAVNGLPDFAFSAEAVSFTYDFEDVDSAVIYRIPLIGEMFRKVREFMIEKYGIDDADKVLPSWQLEQISQPIAAETAEDTPSYQEHHMTTDNSAAVTIPKEVTEKLNALENRANAAEAALTAQKNEIFAKDCRSFCEKLVGEAKLPAGEVDRTIAIMVSLNGQPAQDFGEGADKKSMTPLDAFKEQLALAPVKVELGNRMRTAPNGDTTSALETEFAEFEADPNRVDLNRKTEKIAKEKKISYSEALTIAMRG